VGYLRFVQYERRYLLFVLRHEYDGLLNEHQQERLAVDDDLHAILLRDGDSKRRFLERYDRLRRVVV
jgi:hypothetical protein